MDAMAKAMSMADALFVKLEAQIRSGAIAPGSRLPTQKTIAADEKVSRTVVREAVARLEAQGMAVARQGSGVYVSDEPALTIRHADLSELAGVIELLEVRLAIESETASFAASRRSTEDIRAMQEALREMAAMTADPIGSADADRRFHLAIARAARNDNFLHLVSFFGTRLVPPRNLYLRDQPRSVQQEYVERVRQEHEAILQGIIRMDADAARSAARHHMQESLVRHTELSEAIERQIPNA